MNDVMNLRHLPKGWEMDPQYVYIGRAGHGMDGTFGNPFMLRNGESRGSTLERYRKWLQTRMELDEEFAGKVRALKGKTLVCFCKPAACHGDIIAEELDATG